MARFDAPDALRSSAARSTAQPLTRPVGSIGQRPGRSHTFAAAANAMSNAPSLASLICSHSSSTTRTSGLVFSSSSSPFASREISLSSRHVLKRSSTRWNHAQTASSASSGIASRTSTRIIVPHIGLTSRWGCGTVSFTAGFGRVPPAAIAGRRHSYRWRRRAGRSARSAPAAPRRGAGARPPGRSPANDGGRTASAAAVRR